MFTLTTFVKGTNLCMRMWQSYCIPDDAWFAKERTTKGRTQLKPSPCAWQTLPVYEWSMCPKVRLLSFNITVSPFYATYIHYTLGCFDKQHVWSNGFVSLKVLNTFIYVSVI